MPAIIANGRSSSLSEDSLDERYSRSLQLVDDVKYPAVRFPGYSEKPLSDQLEPIAVVGIGRLQCDAMPATWYEEMMLSS